VLGGKGKEYGGDVGGNLVALREGPRGGWKPIRNHPGGAEVPGSMAPFGAMLIGQKVGEGTEEMARQKESLKGVGCIVQKRNLQDPSTTASHVSFTRHKGRPAMGGYEGG